MRHRCEPLRLANALTVSVRKALQKKKPGEPGFS